MSIEDAIRDTDARFTEAFNRGDLAAVVALHSADALLWVPIVRRREAGKRSRKVLRR